MNMMFVSKRKGHKSLTPSGIERPGRGEKRPLEAYSLNVNQPVTFKYLRYFWMTDGNLLKERWEFILKTAFTVLN